MKPPFCLSENQVFLYERPGEAQVHQRPGLVREKTGQTLSHRHIRMA